MKTAGIFLFVLLSFSKTAKAGEKGGFLWRPDSIKFSIESDTEYMKIGKYLRLEQGLKDGEAGWVESKEDIPDSWEIDTIGFFGEELRIKVQKDGWYYVSPKNYSKLSFSILDGGDKTEAELLAIWNRLGKMKKQGRR